MPKRSLFSSEYLGITTFQRQRFAVNNVSKKEKDEFFAKVQQQFSPSGSKTIGNFTFSDDLKLALNLAENEREVDLVVKMVLNYISQKNRHLNFFFGPIVMRLLHLFNRADTALQLYYDLQHTDFFEHTFSHTILFDLLYENHKHPQLLHIFFTQYPPPPQLLPLLSSLPSFPPLSSSAFSPPPPFSSPLPSSSPSSSSFSSSSSSSPSFSSSSSSPLSSSPPSLSSSPSLPSSPSSSLSSSSSSLSSFSSLISSVPESPSSFPSTSNNCPPQSLQHINSSHLILLAASCFRQNSKADLELLQFYLFNCRLNLMRVSQRVYVYAAMLAYNQGEAETGLQIFKKMHKNCDKEATSTAYFNAKVLLLGKSGKVGKAVSMLESLQKNCDVFQEVLETTRGLCLQNEALSNRIATLTRNLSYSGRLVPMSFSSYITSTIRDIKHLQNSIRKSQLRKSLWSNPNFASTRHRPGLI